MSEFKQLSGSGVSRTANHRQRCKCSLSFILPFSVQRFKNIGGAESFGVRRNPGLRCELSPSPFREVRVRTYEFWVKRDDLLKMKCGLSGNKLRKFWSLLRGLDEYDALVSWGGAQSNALVALAKLTHFHGKSLSYITKKIPRWLKEHPVGNYRTALASSVNFIEVTSSDYSKLYEAFHSDTMRSYLEGKTLPENIGELVRRNSDRLLIIPQGGAWPGAEQGIEKLAQELRNDFAQSFEECGAKPQLFVASGTGTTALFLARHMSCLADIIAIPVVGDANYLREQMYTLDRFFGANAIFPRVLDVGRKRTFGQPDKYLFKIWREVRATGVGDLDLLYGPAAWETIFEALEEGLVDCKRPLVYYCCGGAEGNGSMIGRYYRRFKDLGNLEQVLAEVSSVC